MRQPDAEKRGVLGPGLGGRKRDHNWWRPSMQPAGVIASVYAGSSMECQAPIMARDPISTELHLHCEAVGGGNVQEESIRPMVTSETW